MNLSSVLAQFRSKAVRDLVWSVASPNILHHHFYDDDPKILGLEDSVGQRLVNISMPWLRQLDDPSNDELLDYLRYPIVKAKRLGHYMSELLEFFIQRCPSLRTQKLVCEQQVSRHGEYIGALKFVFLCAPTDEKVRRALHIDPCSVTPGRPALCHWEVSVKFFVHVENTLYIGAFMQEMLSARVQICARKLSLSSEIVIRRWASRELAGDTDPHRVRRLAAACALRGFVFYRAGAPKPQRARYLSPRHGCGFWARNTDEIDVESMDIQPSHWAILPKGHWLSPCRAVPTRDGRFLIPAAEEAGVDEPCICHQGLSVVQRHLDQLSMRCPRTPIMLAGLARSGQMLIETCRGLILPANCKPQDRESRSARGGTPRAFPDPPHPSVAGSRAVREGGEVHEMTGSVLPISLAEVDAGQVPASSAREIIERLDGRGLPHESRGRKLRDAAVCRDRAGALLAASATPEQSVAELAIACCRELIVSGSGPPPVATRLGISLLEAAASCSPCRAADEFFVDAATGRLRGGVAFVLGLRCCELFAVDKSRLSSRQYATDALRDALRLDDDTRLKLATKLVLARGRSNTLSSSELGEAARRLTRARAIELARLLVQCGPQHDTEELDAPAARALIEECARLGHVTKAKKLERAWFGEASQSPHYIVSNMPSVWLRSDALNVESGLLTLGGGVNVRLATTCNLDTDPNGVVGLDVEWPHDDRNAPPSLLQLASTDHCVVIYDLAAMSDRKELARLLNTRTRVVLGFGIDADLAKLKAGYPDDFSDLEVSRCEMRTDKSMSLSALCQVALGAGLSKRYQRSNWRARPLSPEQLHYAALDAFALLAIASVAHVELPSLPPLPNVSFVLGDPPHDALVVKSLALCSRRHLWRRLVAVLPSDARLDFVKLAVAMNCESPDDLRLALSSELLSRFGAPRGAVGPLSARAPVVFHAGLKGRRVATGSGRPETWAVFVADDSFVSPSPRSGIFPEPVRFADIARSAESAAFGWGRELL